jgi:hypothetical protein
MEREGKRGRVMRGIRKSNRGGEYDQSTLYVCIEI